MQKKQTGKIGEAFAREFLQKRKYNILASNYQTRQGEIDIIARKNDKLVFVEVKTRKSRKFGTAAEAVTWTKRQHVMLAALSYLQKEQPKYTVYQFDVIEVYLGKDDMLEEINHIEEAFTYN